jgi:hypothetical protein
MGNINQSQEESFLSMDNWFYDQAWIVLTISSDILLAVNKETFSQFPKNEITSSSCYLPFKYNNKKIFVMSSRTL